MTNRVEVTAALDRLCGCLDDGVVYDFENASVEMVKDLWIVAKAYKELHIVDCPLGPIPERT